MSLWIRIIKQFFPSVMSILLCGMLISLPALFSGCASVKGVSQRFVRSLRQPGEKEILSLEDTSAKHSCSSSKRSKFLIEETDVIPNPVSTGEEIDHRISYAYCPGKVSRSLKGKIVRRVLYKGEQIFQDTTDYQFKPGTWAVDAFISIPKSARKGTYHMELLIIYADKTIKRDNKFTVKK